MDANMIRLIETVCLKGDAPYLVVCYCDSPTLIFDIFILNGKR